MPALVETIASYVPSLIARKAATSPKSLTVPDIERFDGAALFADISGFTHLTERLVQGGHGGSEELAGLLNDYFGQLISLIAAHGGDVVKFEGDALLALWPAGDEELATATR